MTRQLDLLGQAGLELEPEAGRSEPPQLTALTSASAFSASRSTVLYAIIVIPWRLVESVGSYLDCRATHVKADGRWPPTIVTGWRSTGSRCTRQCSVVHNQAGQPPSRVLYRSVDSASMCATRNDIPSIDRTERRGGGERGQPCRSLGHRRQLILARNASIWPLVVSLWQPSSSERISLSGSSIAV